MKAAAALFVLLLTGTVCAQTRDSSAKQAMIRFTFEDPQLEPAVYSIKIFEDGTGNYSASYTASAAGGSTAQNVQQTIQIHNPLLAHLFEVARSHQFFAINCEAAHNRVAFTGKKTLAYEGPGGSGSCTFNYSRDPSLNGIASDLTSVAFTLDEGMRLQSEHLHDRLALYDELASLKNAVQDQRALELGNIAPELESIANDEAVMNLARQRARALLPAPASLR